MYFLLELPLFIYLFFTFFCPPTDATEVLLCLLLLAIIFFLQTPKQQDLLCLCPPIQSGCEKDFGKNCWGEKQLLPPPKRFVSMSLTAFSLYCTNVFPSANVLARDRTTRSIISGALKQPGTWRRDEEPSETRGNRAAASKSHFKCSKEKGVPKR